MQKKLNSTARLRALAAGAVLILTWPTGAQVALVTIDTSPAGQRQVIDGFGTGLYGTEPAQAWWQNLYYGDLRASMLRMDLTPVFNSSYSDNEYNSPGYAQAGPNGNYVRTYTNATTYTNVFAGRQAKIAVMGPDINSNIAYFDFTASGFNADGSNLQVAGQAAQAGKSRFNSLGDFKLFATILSPAPWLKLADGRVYGGGNGANYPAVNTPFPFIWLGNFAGGVLDTSGTARAEFDDSSLGGSGPTSALTQFARGTAAYLRGFQNAYGVPLYALSIQNELNFDEFYHSCYYPSASGYLAAIKAVRAELDQYPDLADIKIMGPEDILEVDAYGLWQYGSGSTAAAKNLQFLQAVGADPGAAAALDFFCIHGYSFTSYDAPAFDTTQTLWDWWANGWGASPAPGIPANVEGFTDYGKKSWQTEFSGDDPAWLSPSSGFPGDGAWAMALRIQQALTVGRESAWAYSRLADGNPVTSDLQVLTDSTSLQNSPKYVAAKHFFRYIRPNSLCVNASLTGSTALTASAFLNTTNATMTVVLINSSNGPVQAVIDSPAQPAGIPSWQTFTSSNGSYWQVSTTPIANGSANVSIPGYGVVTLYGVAPSGLSLTWNIPAAITYGTALGSQQLNATANVPGTFAYTPTNGAVLDAGTNTLSVIFTPTDTVGYTSATGTLSLVVSPALLTVTAANASRNYGQANPLFMGTVAGVTNGDNITASYGCIATSTTQAGTYSIVPSLVDPDNRRSNYTVSLIDGTFTITTAVPLLAWTASPAITYGTGLSSLQLNATASVPGTFAYNPPAGTALGVGTAQLYVLFTPDDTTDYTTASASVNLAVLKAPLAATAANATRTYGTSNPSATGTILGLVNGDSISAAYACAATPTSLPGAYPIVPTLVDPNNQLVNYAVTLSDGTLTVTPATAPTLFSVTPDTGLTNGGATITLLGTGFENGATVAFGSNTASTVDFLNSTNLTVLTPPSVPGTVDVIVTNADGQVATLTNGFTYGEQPFVTSQPANQAAPFGTGVQLTVLAGGTEPLGYQWQFNGANLTDGGPYTGSQSNLLAIADAALGDAGIYAVVVTNAYGSATSAPAMLTIAPATPVLTWAIPAAITYGMPLSPNQLDATASVARTFAYTPPAGTVLDAGTTQLSVLFTPTDTADFTTASAGVNLAVLKAPLTVAADNATRTYGTSNPSFTGTVVGLVNGDSISAAIACAATPTSLPGSYPIVPSLVDPNNQQGNYQVALVNGTLTVTPAAAPTLVSVTPNLGLTNGGTSVSIAGNGFENGATVNFGAWPAASVEFINSTNLTAVTPPSGSGTVDVILTNADGQVATLTNSFTYAAPPVFQTAQQSGGVLTLTWSATAGQPYQVQYKTNLSQPDWANWVVVAATNSTATASDAMSSPGQRFYRVTWLPYR